jgi:ABC-2 type transport system permease protein
MTAGPTERPPTMSTRSGARAYTAGSLSAGPRLARLCLARGVVELRQFSRSREAVVFTLAFPIILLVIFGAVVDDKLGDGVNYAQYFTAGMIASALLNSGFQNLGITIPIERDDGTLKRLRGTPLPRTAYFVGKVIMVVTVAVIQIVLLGVVGVLFYDLNLPSDVGHWVTFVWVFALGITACTLCGIAFSSVPKTARASSALVTPVALVLQFISGVFFQYDNLPSWMQQIAALFPLKWLTQGMRSVFLPDAFAHQEVAGSWEHGKTALVLAIWCVVGLVLCMRTFRWQRRGED